jgi:hypothetical protein
MVSFGNKECYVVQPDFDGKIGKDLPLEASVPKHEMDGDEGRNGISALMDLAFTNLDVLREYALTQDENIGTLLNKTLDNREKYMKRMERQLKFNRYLNDNNRMNFENIKNEQ